MTEWILRMRIVRLRRKLLKVVETSTSLLDPRVLAVSQQLDRHIVAIQRRQLPMHRPVTDVRRRLLSDNYRRVGFTHLI